MINMTLKARKPELVVPRKPVFMISGKPGVGKTYFSQSFNDCYYIDVEGGSTREQYIQKMIENKGVYFGLEDGSQDFDSVNAEIKELSRTKHPYKTLVIDTYSKLYNLTAAKAELEIGNEFGRDKKEANKPTRQMISLLNKLDMTTIIICHTKDKWERTGKEIVCTGTTYDGFEKLEYELDLWLEMEKTGKNRTFKVRKSRINAFPEGTVFPAVYEEFANRYGKDVIERESVPVVLATPEQIARVKELWETLNTPPTDIVKWLANMDVESINDVPQEKIAVAISKMETKLQSLTKGSE